MYVLWKWCPILYNVLYSFGNVSVYCEHFKSVYIYTTFLMAAWYPTILWLLDLLQLLQRATDTIMVCSNHKIAVAHKNKHLFSLQDCRRSADPGSLTPWQSAACRLSSPHFDLFLCLDRLATSFFRRLTVGTTGVILSCSRWVILQEASPGVFSWLLEEPQPRGNGQALS